MYYIFGPKHDGPRVLRKLETFGKFRNPVWVPPFPYTKYNKIEEKDSFKVEKSIKDLFSTHG